MVIVYKKASNFLERIVLTLNLIVLLHLRVDARVVKGGGL